MNDQTETGVTRRTAFRRLGVALAGGAAFACVSTNGAQATGLGPCTACSCGGFIGAGSYPLVCQRCGHSWQVHR